MQISLGCAPPPMPHNLRYVDRWHTILCREAWGEMSDGMESEGLYASSCTKPHHPGIQLPVKLSSFRVQEDPFRIGRFSVFLQSLAQSYQSPEATHMSTR
jgi:hypothetical protein